MSSVASVARRAGANLARVARRLAERALLPPRSGVWLHVALGPGPDEVPAPRLPWARDDGLVLLDVLTTLERAASDPQVDGVLLRLKGPLPGFSKVVSLRRAVERLRQAGVPVVAYADALDAQGLLLASAADRIWLPETSQVMLVGLRLEGFFLRRLLDRVGVRAEVLRVGDHKSAAERFTRDHMSAEEREQLEALADDWYAALVDGIAAGRGLEPAAVRDRIDRGPYTARAAEEAGLVDGCCYPDELEERLEALARVPGDGREGPRRVRLLDASTYHSLRVGDPGWLPLLHGLPRIAYVVARGGIHRGGGPRGIAADPVRQLLHGVAKQPDVRGVVLRIDSPGGEPLASDLLWRQIRQLRREKPVVVSMAEVAASGGYYMAVGGDRVLAEPVTVTGSIGVVGGKLDLGGLYDTLGVTREGVERGARAGLMSEARGFTPDERKALREEFAAVYADFVARVAEGRGLSTEAVERLAGGRVWSGARALEHGLVDALGGPLEALGEARRLAGLSPDERCLVDVHPRLPQIPGLRGLLRLLPGRTRLP